MSDIERLLEDAWSALEMVGDCLPSDDAGQGDNPETDWANPELDPDVSDNEFGGNGEQAEGESLLYFKLHCKLAERFRRHVQLRNLDKLRDVWDEIEANQSYISCPLPSNLIDRAMEALDELDTIAPTRIYKHSPQPSIVIPNLVACINAALMKQIAINPQLLYQLSPRAFEEFMAEIFLGFGYAVEITAASRDGGKDLVAIKCENQIRTKILVECKRYAPTNKVGIALVERLHSVKITENASKALLVTTSYFTGGATAFERQHLFELELKDFDAVASWASQHRISSEGGRYP